MNTNKDIHYIEKDNAISIIRILADKMADENIDVAAEQFISAIQDAIETDAIYELREKLRIERKKKKRWKRKWLKSIAAYNELKIMYMDVCEKLKDEKLRDKG